ncbi:MAG: segregation/condensation protein A [Clostridiales bacterium]|nr:segregation/condensation protein A [Clostridiales bacterium]
MSSITFKLEKFEGPLDLLLHLISKHKLNIYDIEIASLLEQYFVYIDGLNYQDFELAGEFLEMAARLIYIKTVSLLPKPNEAELLKKELEGNLIEYSLCKKAAERLKANYVGADIFVRKQAEIEIDKSYNRLHNASILLDAYLGISVRVRNNLPLKSSLFQPIVSKKIISVTSKIIFVLRKLYNCGTFEMDKLYDGMTDRSERVATFLAILELTKSGRITLNDDNSEIYFKKREKRH